MASTLLVTFPAEAQAALSAPALDAPRAAVPKEKHSLKIPALQFAIGAAAAALAVPAAIALGSWVGTLSPNFLAAGIPALLLYALLPAFAVAGLEYWLGNALEPGSYRFWGSFGVTLGVHLITTAVAVLLGASGADLGSASAFVLLEMILLPGVATTMFQLLRTPPAGEVLLTGAAPPSRPLLDAEHPLAQVSLFRAAF